MGFLAESRNKLDGPVLVIGGAGVDMVGRLEKHLQLGSSTPAKIRSSFGGVARNVAENLARLGLNVHLITVVGEDDTGERLLQNLLAAGVNIKAILKTSKHPTGSYLAVVNEKGEFQFGLDDLRAMTVLTPDYIRQYERLFKEAAFLFIDANIPKNTLRTIMSLARQAKLLVGADPTSASLAERLTRYLPRLNLITPNNAEASLYCDQTLKIIQNRKLGLEAAKHLVSQGVEIAIITLAELGMCYATSETSGYIPAIHTDIVDPTGAGDALTAAVLFGLLNNIPLDDAMRLGVSAASLTLRYPGAVVPDLSIEKLYDQLVI